MPTHAQRSNGLEAFRLAALRSERGRIIGMMGLFTAFMVFGLVRVVRPVFNLPDIGLVIGVLSAIYVLIEAGAFIHVNRLIRTQRIQPCVLLMGLAVVETLFPLVTMFLLIQYEGIDPRLMPVGPGYAVLFMLLTMSTLRADPPVSAMVGGVSLVGYCALVGWVLRIEPDHAEVSVESPVYFTCIVVLLFGAVVSWFVTVRVRSYIYSVAQEGELRAERARVNRDLEAAREVQQRLLPDSMPTIAGYDLAAMSRSADKTGGDYYDWQSVSDTRVVVSIADVTGHGIGPALVTAACRAYVRATVNGERAISEVIRRVDALLSDDMPSGRFVTFAMLDLDFANHRGVFLSAGHGPSFYLRGADGSVSPVDSQGLPLGLGGMDMLEDPIAFDFAPDDVVVLFSDGFFEWADTSGEQFGIERLAEVIRSCRTGPAQKIIDAMDASVRAHAGDLPQPDDMTTVVIKRNG